MNGRLKLARDPDEVVEALRTLADDLDLVALEMGETVVRANGVDQPSYHHEHTQLETCRAEWVWDESKAERDPGLEAERRTVVRDLLLEADRRLAELDGAF